MTARRRHSALIAVVLAALVLTGCQQPPAPMSQMQTLVVDIADQIAAGDTASATSTLDALEAEVGARLAAGEIDAAEADRIRAAVAQVRADLAALTTPTPEPEASEATDPVEPAESTIPAVEPETPVEPTVTETEDADDTDDAPGNSGNTPGNNGNGNKGNNGKDKGKKDD